MEDTLITYETAKLAKEKDFQELCFYYYDENKKLRQPYLENGSSSDTEFKVELEDLLENFNNKYRITTSASTQSLLQKWLREVHNLHVWCIPNNEPTIAKGYLSFLNGKFILDSSYEEALEAGLLEALKLIK